MGQLEHTSDSDGPMWDLAEDPVSIALIEAFYNANKPVAAVCHAPGVLRHVKYKGEPLVKGKRVTGKSGSNSRSRTRSARRRGARVGQRA